MLNSTPMPDKPQHPVCPQCNKPAYCPSCDNGDKVRTAKQRKLVNVAAASNGELTHRELAIRAGYTHKQNVTRALSTETIATAIARKRVRTQDKARQLKDLAPSKLLDQVHADKLTPMELGATWKTAEDIVARSPDAGTSVSLDEADEVYADFRKRRQLAAYLRFALDHPTRAGGLLSRLVDTMPDR